jgi:hypothetical protein
LERHSEDAKDKNFHFIPLVAELTHLGLSMEARCSMFELAFWVLYFYQKLL